MAGKKPVEIFEYNSEGEFVRKFKTQVECRIFHYAHIEGKIPILRLKRMNIKYSVLDNGNFLVKERLGRSRIKFLRRLHESDYCTDLINREKRIIQVFNLEGILLLEARNLNVLTKLTNIPQGTISQQLSRGVQSIPKGEFLIKYKEEEVEL